MGRERAGVPDNSRAQFARCGSRDKYFYKVIVLQFKCMPTKTVKLFIRHSINSLSGRLIFFTKSVFCVQIRTFMMGRVALLRAVL